MNQLDRNFLIHILKYVGVGLISGSIVHAGTLGGHSLRYIVLVVLGVFAFIAGTLLEEGLQKNKKIISYVLISVIVSIGTGMVSGGLQHYLDGPKVAAFLIPIGLFIGYLSFMFRDYSEQSKKKNVILKACIYNAVIFAILYAIAYKILA